MRGHGIDSKTYSKNKNNKLLIMESSISKCMDGREY